MQNEQSWRDLCIYLNGVSHTTVDVGTFYRIMKMYEENGECSLSAMAVVADYEIVNLQSCNLTIFPTNHLIIRGSLVLQSSPDLTTLPEYLYVTKHLYIQSCPALIDIPPTINVKGTIYCDKEHIESIPDDKLPLYMGFNFYPQDTKKFFMERLKGATHV